MRIHALSPSALEDDAHASHATCRSATRASRFLTGLVTRFAMHDGIPRGKWIKTWSQTSVGVEEGRRRHQLAGTLDLNPIDVADTRADEILFQLHIRPLHGDRELARITPDTVRTWRAELLAAGRRRPLTA